ncbi:hypothetical protein [Enterobacter huaxiensis]|uniref:hypothetical protein n=1 Tax=Enterobacter huaxiensis TaxID=2494702 RepID=UPI000E766226|nr:hypothetical protein [Enterobacter huaxiensis]UNC48949.1 hypothetical protein D5067_0004935 [Enterobacter huaxiensis]
MVKNITSAYYIPSRYTIFSYSSTEIRKNIDFDDATLFHEFLHFIQDITLPYLIRQSTFSSLERYYFSISAIKAKQITVPFYNWPDDYHTLSQQYDFTWGEQQAIKNFGTVISHNKVSEPSINDINVHKYILKSSTDMECTLSAKDLIEFITRKIENKRWPEKNYYDIPYKIVDLVLDYLGLGELSDSTKILLVEFCLYNDNPVNQLFFISKDFKNKIIYSDIHNSAYDLFKSYQWNSKGNFSENASSKLSRRKESHLEYFSECYKGDQFLTIREWIYYVFNYNFKDGNNFFIFHFLFNLDPMTLKFKMEEYFSEIGMPVLINETGEHRSAVPDRFRSNNFIYLYVESLLIQSLRNGDWMCPLLKYKMCNGIGNNNIWCKNDFLNVIARKQPCLMTEALDKMNLSHLPIIRINFVNSYNA